MKKIYYYSILLLISIFFVAPLQATQQRFDELKNQAPGTQSILPAVQKIWDDLQSQQANIEINLASMYDAFNNRQLPTAVVSKKRKPMLIYLAKHIKAKDGRKVYFFVGSKKAGTSLSITALQGNKIRKGANKIHREDEKKILDNSDQECFENVNEEEKRFQKSPFCITYLLPKNEVPVLAAASIAPKNPYIYYPNPKNKQYEGIAFADTAGFFQKSEAMGSLSLFYALKVNSVGGLVLVLNAEALDRMREQEGLKRFAYILQAYFPKAVSQKNMKESILVLFTNVDGKASKASAISKFTKGIQAFYQAYYTNTDNQAKREQLDEKLKAVQEAYNNNLKKTKKINQQYEELVQEEKYLQQARDQLDKACKEKKKEIDDNMDQEYDWILADEQKKLDRKRKELPKKEKNLQEKREQLDIQYEALQQEYNSFDDKLKKIGVAYEKLQKETRCMKLLFEMLLKQDVPKKKIGNINNFTLDKQRFGFILPWRQKSVDEILDKQLKSLKPIPGNHLFTFDEPILQDIEANIRNFSIELGCAIQPLRALQREVLTIEKQIKGMQNPKVVVQAMEGLKEGIDAFPDAQIAIQQDNTLEVVFQGTNYQNLPLGWQAVKGFKAQYKGYSMCKSFIYRGQEPIYQIEATYGCEALLSEEHPFLSCVGGAITKSNFIAKHFNITTTTDHSGKVTWKAVAKDGRGVQKTEWKLYHAITGKNNAACDITFYALKRERIAMQKLIKKNAKEVKSLVDQMVVYNLEKANVYTWPSKYEAKMIKCKRQQRAQRKTWRPTVQMLQFFAHNILQEGANKALIKVHLKNFKEAMQQSTSKSNNQQSKPNTAEEKGDQPDADDNKPNDHQPSSVEVFDID